MSNVWRFGLMACAFVCSASGFIVVAQAAEIEAAHTNGARSVPKAEPRGAEHPEARKAPFIKTRDSKMSIPTDKKPSSVADALKPSGDHQGLGCASAE